MTLRASTQINIFLCTIFSFGFFGKSLKNLRNIEFLAKKGPWVFFNLEFFENGQKKPGLLEDAGLLLGTAQQPNTKKISHRLRE